MSKYAAGVCVMVLTLSVQAQVQFTGTVTTADSGALEGAAVVVGDDQRFGAVTDRDGHFRVNGLRPGPQRVRVSSMGYLEVDTIIHLDEGTSDLLLELKPQAVLMRPAEVTALRAGERTPFAKSVLTKEEIARMNTGVDLPYLLEAQPSTVATSDAGTGIGYTYMRIRGSDATRTNITVNGVPFNDAESKGAFLVNMPDLATSAEDIEVQRGVGTSTNGPAAFGASVNVRTTAVRREPWGLVSVSGGSFNTQRYSVSAGTGLLAHRFSLDVRLSSITSDGYIDRASADLKSYFLQGAWMGRTRSLRFITFRGKEVTYQAWGGVPREVIDTARTYNGYTYRNEVDNYDQTHYQLLLDQRFGDRAAVHLTLFHVPGAGYYEQFRTDDDLAIYGIATAVIDGDTITSTDLVRRRWLDNTLTGANLGVHADLGRHRLVIGGSYALYEGEHFGEVIWARYAGNTDIGHRYYDNEARKTDVNLFGKLTLALGDHFDVYGDLQIRQVDHRFLGYDNDLENITQQVRHTFFNPKAGALWRAHEGGKVYASFAVGNREPNRDDLVETTPSGRPRSERLFDYELGYERRSGRFSGGLNLYYMDYTDQLVLTGELNDVGAALRTNVPRSYRTGAELSLAARILSWLTFRGNVTLSRNKVPAFTEFVDDWDLGGQRTQEHVDKDLAFSPSMIASGEAAFRVWHRPDKGSAEVTWIARYVGAQYLDNTSSPDRMLDPYFVNDLRANVTLLGMKGLKGIDLHITVRNLFSELYESNGWVYSYVYEGRRQEMVGLFPQAPLNVLAGVSLRF
ncbi:MAG: TonB-dependent receptor [Flavobacteriales bacterium]|jgi:iron complex outermembrane receptor protein|nr:TonB-dependent receptor [Flavobacteriales bacterium]MBK7753558.1 TonB-dependent receptor [Flavobacteriales bacterium]MBK9538421.1 TonB-dependent receptor [Flavobacteriales bacterium]